MRQSRLIFFVSADMTGFGVAFTASAKAMLGTIALAE